MGTSTADYMRFELNSESLAEEVRCTIFDFLRCWQLFELLYQAVKDPALWRLCIVLSTYSLHFITMLSAIRIVRVFNALFY